MRKQLLSATCFCIALTAMAQIAQHGGGKAWTTGDIFQKGGPTGRAPRDYLWSPDNVSVTYLFGGHRTWTTG